MKDMKAYAEYLFESNKKNALKYFIRLSKQYVKKMEEN